MIENDINVSNQEISVEVEQSGENQSSEVILENSSDEENNKEDNDEPTNTSVRNQI